MRGNTGVHAVGVVGTLCGAATSARAGMLAPVEFRARRLREHGKSRTRRLRRVSSTRGLCSELRADIDQRVLANLLRLNLERSGGLSADP